MVHITLSFYDALLWLTFLSVFLYLILSFTFQTWDSFCFFYSSAAHGMVQMSVHLRTPGGYQHQSWAAVPPLSLWMVLSVDLASSSQPCAMPGVSRHVSSRGVLCIHKPITYLRHHLSQWSLGVPALHSLMILTGQSPSLFHSEEWKRNTLCGKSDVINAFSFYLEKWKLYFSGSCVSCFSFDVVPSKWLLNYYCRRKKKGKFHSMYIPLLIVSPSTCFFFPCHLWSSDAVVAGIH